MIEQVSITTKSPAETFRFATALGRLATAGDVVLLEGDLGAGKTLFSKGVAKGLDVDDEVTSPTFSLVAEYTGRLPFVHMDLYRLYAQENDSSLTEDALSAISFDDYLDGHRVVLVEWPAGAADRVQDALFIRITAAPLPHVDSRVLSCRATGPSSAERLRMWVTSWLSS